MKGLVISRRARESFAIGDSITVTVTRIDANRVNLNIVAPDDLKILRTELIGREKPIEPVT